MPHPSPPVDLGEAVDAFAQAPALVGDPVDHSYNVGCSEPEAADRSITGCPGQERPRPGRQGCGRRGMRRRLRGEKPLHLPEETPATSPLNGGTPARETGRKYCSEVRRDVHPRMGQEQRISSKTGVPGRPKIATRFIRFPILPIYSKKERKAVAGLPLREFVRFGAPSPLRGLPLEN